MEGIYMIKNQVNGKIYIGESVDIDKRLEKHIEDLTLGSHNRKFNEDIKTYGIDIFEFKIIKEVPQMGLSKLKHNLLRLVYEDFYIKKYNSVNNGYNCQYTLNCVRDGRKNLFDTEIGLKTINKIIDILYGIINEYEEYSIENEIEYRNNYKLSKIDKKTLLNVKLRSYYKDYDFINKLISLIEINKDKIGSNIMQYYDDENCFNKDFIGQHINLYINFINRFKFSIGEYVTMAYFMFNETDYDEWTYFFDDLISLDEYKIMKKEVLSSYNEDDLKKIQIAIFESSYLLAFDNKFEIPSFGAKGILGKISSDYAEIWNDKMQY